MALEFLLCACALCRAANISRILIVVGITNAVCFTGSVFIKQVIPTVSLH